MAVVVAAGRLLCCWLWLSRGGAAEAFNLEPRIPVVKEGAPESYFGFSVALHQTLHGTSVLSWILVGAPRDQNLQPNSNRSGALWKCPLTMKLDDCEQVVTDGKRDLSDAYDDSVNASRLFPVNKNEIKTDQWMGVTVRSQGPGRKVLVCAHRYIAKGNDYQWGRGLCYTLNQWLEWENAWEPCVNRKTNRGHEQWGYCQVGTSGFLTENDVALLGTPGPYTWRGTVFAVNISDSYLDRDKTFYHVPVTENNSPVDKYSYLGFSVAAGRFFGDHVSYVAGAPRANGTGVVVFFRKPPSSPSGNSTLLVELTLPGHVFASSFGYELATADFNADGFSDLIVGAPFYYSKNKGGAVYVYMNPGPSAGSGAAAFPKAPSVVVEGQPESRFGLSIANLRDINQDGYDDVAVGAPYEGQGSVHIFLGSAAGFIGKPSQVLYASDMPLPVPKSFGYSLSGGMDLDGNGYPDLLVGAYADSKVFLIRARPVIGIVTRVDPIDNMTNVDPSAAGCSLDSGAASVCFAFRACFQMNTTKKLNDLEMRYRIEAETFAKTKFSRVRFRDGLPERSNVVEKRIRLSKHNVNYSKCTEEVVYLKDNVQDIQTALEFKLTYSLTQEQPVYSLRWEDMNQFPILNQQEAIKYFQAQFHKDCGDNDVCESDLHLEVTTNLKLDEDGLPALQLGEQNEIVLRVLIVNRGESAYMAALYVAHADSVTFTGKLKTQEPSPFECSDVSRGILKCTLGNPFKHGSGELQLRFNPSGLTDVESHVEFGISANTTSVETHLQEPIVLVAKVVKRAELSIIGQARPELVIYGGAVVGESALQYLDEVGLRVEHVYEVINRGPWRATKLNVIISWPYEVENNRTHGKWLLYLTDVPHVVGGDKCEVPPERVNVLRLRKRPGELDEEEPLLHPTYDAGVEAASSGENDASGGFPAYRKESREGRLRTYVYRGPSKEPDESRVGRERRRRDVMEPIADELVVDKDGRKKRIVTMKCGRTAKCFRFKCVIRNLLKDQSMYIRVPARLWNATLVEDYPRVQRVEIQSRAEIEVEDRLLDQDDLTDDWITATTKAYPDPRLVQEEVQKVPLWVIVVSVLTGLALLVILTLILWRMGFFKRPNKALQNGRTGST